LITKGSENAHFSWYKHNLVIRTLSDANFLSDVSAAKDGHQMNRNTPLTLKSESFKGRGRFQRVLPIHRKRQSASSVSRLVAERVVDEGQPSGHGKPMNKYINTK
jgi:hypothetical protein